MPARSSKSRGVPGLIRARGDCPGAAGGGGEGEEGCEARGASGRHRDAEVFDVEVGGMREGDEQERDGEACECPPASCVHGLKTAVEPEGRWNLPRIRPEYKNYPGCARHR